MNTAKDNLELFKEIGANSYESSRTLTELNLRAWEKLAEKQMATLNMFIDTGIEQLKLATEIKDTKTLIAGQTELNKSLGENLKASGVEVMELASNTQEEYRDWFQQGLSLLNNEIKHAVENSIK